MQKIIQWISFASIFWLIGYLQQVYFEPEIAWVSNIYRAKQSKVSDLSHRSPKILFVGGSGTHFGIDATYVEKNLRIPAVNMGLHAGLGLNAILANVSKGLTEGDIVVLTIEYGLLENDGSGPFASGFSAQTLQPGIGGFGAEQVARETWLMGVPGTDRWVQLAKRLSKRILGRAIQESQNSDYVSTLDERGNPLVLPEATPSPLMVSNRFSPYAKQRLVAFRDNIASSGASLIIALPWLYVSEEDVTSSENVRSLIVELSNIAPVAHNEQLNLVFDPKFIGDTPYHLSQLGRQLRSEEMSMQLQEWLK